MSQDPLVGTMLGGARLLQRVSKGLMAHVYQGHYERLGVPVAVKVLSPKATSQGVNRERFIREGRALAQLSHPNIIKIYNVGHENGRFFIIMDWIQDGMNLRQLAQTRPLTPAQSLKVVQRLCDALEYIHSRELVHRDIKPANVCLRRGGHPVLMDFSLIKDQKSDVQLTAPGTIMGTVNFMPPEQAQPGGAFGNVGPRSDVYSIGGAAYWLLTGQPPFKGRTPMETIIKLMREQPVPPSKHNPSLPKVVDDLVLAALAKKSSERPESAKAFADRVEFLFQNHRAELDAAQRPALAEGAPAPAAPAAPARPAAPAAPAAPARPAAQWGSSSSQGAASPVATAPPAQQRTAAPPQPMAPNPMAPPQPMAPAAANPMAPPQPQPMAPPQPQPMAQNPMAPPQPMAQNPMAPPQPMAQNPMAPPQPIAAAAQPAAESFAPAPGAEEDGEGGGGVFVASMSTEGAAAGMLQLPEELRMPAEPKQKGGGKGSLVVTILLVLIILLAGGVAVAIFGFGWQPPFLG